MVAIKKMMLGLVLLLGLCLPMGLGVQAASQPYATSVGAPPVATSAAFPKWVDKLIAQRLAECPIARGTTLYVSQSTGNDSNPGTKAQPYKSTTKVNSVIAAGSGDQAFLFMCGDTWRGTTDAAPIVINSKNNITLASYVPDSAFSGTLVTQKPRLYFGAKQYLAAAGGWTTAGGAYYKTETTPMAWIRLADDLGTPYVHASDATDVQSRDNSWFWDAGTNRIYINPPGATNVNSITLDGATYQANNGISVGTTSGTECDGVRIHGLRVDFGGIQDFDAAHTGLHAYGIEFVAAAGKYCVVSDCESWYSGYHNIGTGSFTAGGGLTVINCITGFQRSAIGGGGAGGSDTVFFGDGVEGLNINTEYRYGPLPGCVGTGLGGHAAPAKLGLYVERGCYFPGGTLAHTQIGSMTDLVVVGGDLSKCRAFVLNRRIGSPSTPWNATLGGDIPLAVENFAQIGSLINVKSTATIGQAQLASTDGGDGWCINTTVLLDYQGGVGAFSHDNGVGHTQRYWNCAFGFTATNSGAIAGFDSLTMGGTQSAEHTEVKQCVLQVQGGAGFISGWPVFPGINNNQTLAGAALPATMQDGNSYVSFRRTDGYLSSPDTAYRGASTDPHLVTPSFPVVIDGTTIPSDKALFISGMPILCEYDALMRTRTRSSCGPIAVQESIQLQNVQATPAGAGVHSWLNN